MKALTIAAACLRIHLLLCVIPGADILATARPGQFHIPDNPSSLLITWGEHGVSQFKTPVIS